MKAMRSILSLEGNMSNRMSLIIRKVAYVDLTHAAASSKPPHLTQTPIRAPSPRRSPFQCPGVLLKDPAEEEGRHCTAADLAELVQV